MLNAKMQEELNKQINAEIYSAYLYLAMAAYFETINLKGFANWLKVQSQEELVHAMKMFSYVNERDGEVILTSIDSPPSKWDSPLAAAKSIYEHERKVTGLINNLVILSRFEQDYATDIFLQWFVKEQVEEEASADAIVQKITLMGDASSALLMLDAELGKRVFK